MRLEQALDYLVEAPHPEDFSTFQKDIDPDWIEEALYATGTATIRRRRLPAEQVIWVVIGMALYRDRPIKEVVRSLNLALPKPDEQSVVPSAVVQARSRLGEEPLAWLFSRCAHEWVQSSIERDRWRGLAIFGVDGTTLTVPDSKENREYFGLSTSRRGESGYPLVRLVALMDLRSHLLVNASFGPYEHGEHTYAGELWASVPDNSLTILDKGFLSASLLLSLNGQGENRHWLLPAKKNSRWRRVKRFGKNDELVEMQVSAVARAKDPSLPKTWTARAIRYQRKGFRPRILLTSLVDSEQYPAKEIVALYHERWELELGYDEIKTEMLGNTKQPLRSTNPSRVCQEIWGLLIAYNLLRLEMARIADEANVKPTRISFIMVFRMICDEWYWCSNTSPGNIPRYLKELRRKVKLFILPERRSERSYPRAVKVKMSNYAKKRRSTPIFAEAAFALPQPTGS